MRDRVESVITGVEFVHAMLVAELFDRGPDVATREGFDGFLEGGILLSHDGIQTHRLDAGGL